MSNPSYVLCCESTTDADEQFHLDRNLKYVYFNYELDGELCKDDFGRTHTPEDLYERMLGGAEVRTSQVSVGDYINHWRPFLEAGQDVLHVTLSSDISGTYNSACAARDQIAPEFPDRKVFVVDSLNASGGYAVMMDKLAKLRDGGMPIDELAAWAEAHRLEVQTWFFTSDLTFLIRGGRVSKASGLIGGVLKICPIMTVIAPDGSLSVVEKIRTKKKAEARVAQIMSELVVDHDGYDDLVFINNSACLEDAKDVEKLVLAEFPQLGQQIVHSNVGATIGCHLGPGTVVLSFWGKERMPVAKQ